MSTVKSFEDLKIWQMGRELCKEVFRITHYELFSKDYRLKDQIKASSGSIMDNIAEGFQISQSIGSFINYLKQSELKGSKYKPDIPANNP